MSYIFGDFHFINIDNFILFLAIGAGQTHNAELHTDIYRDPNTKIYVDSWGNARNELKSIEELITGEIGDIINGSKSLPPSGITIFHSLGLYYALT